MAKQLHKGDESRRRSNIIRASRSCDAEMLPQLLALLRENETLENRRHIVRALGNIGGSQAEAKLLNLLEYETGLILGDIANSLGKPKSAKALPAMERLLTHPEAWVVQNARFAIRQIRNNAARFGN